MEGGRHWFPGSRNGPLGAARRYAEERKAFGKAIAEQQAVAFKLADMATEGNRPIGTACRIAP
ncbi:hypothetical protein CN116_30785 [Sinorhizobium meliloti]|nr:hypothetical protein [Sinorhizobium meliloti]RVM02722.1 hypothetical protein CN125_32195 [Sinorhizobium meliloti]RVM40427.1 hypothetical protein CN121_31270 [Sinorhizobium meliloti]RVM56239.1 hypothetical protein CN124_32015 [Sinorhizobium meliloti]RVM60328.1 hypothetical protein CN123_31010 [Sinorhizobium meliloti]